MESEEEEEGENEDDSQAVGPPVEEVAAPEAAAAPEALAAVAPEEPKLEPKPNPPKGFEEIQVLNVDQARARARALICLTH